MPWRLLRWSQTVDVLPLLHIEAEVLASPVHLSSYLLKLQASTKEVRSPPLPCHPSGPQNHSWLPDLGPKSHKRLAS